MDFNGTFIATIITFVLFVFVMNKILYAPILNIMKEREEFIHNNHKDAEQNKAKAEELENEKKAKLDSAGDNARSKYIEAVDEYKTQKSDIIAEAQNKAHDEIEQSIANLKEVSDEVKNGLKSSINDLANDIVERVIGYRSTIENFDEDKVNEIFWGAK